MTTIKEVLNKGINILKSAGIEAPALEAGVILCHVLDCDRTYLYMYGEKNIGECKADGFFSMVGQRLEGKPLQYITGCREFMSLDFKVNSNVLIPRQDTEILVETVIEYTKGMNGSLSILDIGTGSGCIAVSLAHFIEDSLVTAVDISEEALAVAGENAANAGVGERVRFVHSNLFEGLADMPEKFDIIVSNPPYIPAYEIETLEPQVKDYEPLTALDGGADGLDFYRAISKESVNYLKPGGLLAFEVGYNQAREVSGLMEDLYCDIDIVKDLAGIERVVKGRVKV